MSGIATRSVLFGAALSLVSTFAVAQTKSVDVTYIVDHPAINAVVKGVKDVLKEKGFVEGSTLKWRLQSAQGNPTIAAQIAKTFVGDNPNVIVAIGTPSAIAVANQTKKIPVVFGGITDPVGAKLVKSLDAPGGNVTGTSDMSPMDKHLAMIKKLWPKAKRVGFIYNSGEANSVTLLRLAKVEAGKQGLTIVEAVAPQTSQVLTAARSLVGKADVIYLPTDNTVGAAVQAVVKVSREAKIPTFAADTNMVKQGAVAGLGFDYYDIGRVTGEMVVDILKGKSPSAMPVRFVNKLALVLNAKSAKAVGFRITSKWRKMADKVIE
jgi:putative tryptophan/tyrosine transport system substrate-binding protein